MGRGLTAPPDLPEVSDRTQSSAERRVDGSTFVAKTKNCSIKIVSGNKDRSSPSLVGRKRLRRFSFTMCVETSYSGTVTRQ